eukprot:SM000031S11599  [mRNA]  locus=s31:597962:599769:+ [translate_table: standard]
MAAYTRGNGSRAWLPNAHAHFDSASIPMATWAAMVAHRAAETLRILDLAEALDAGRLPPLANVARAGPAALAVATALRGRLSLRRLAVAGHSMGAATAIMAAGADARPRACLALDAWWTPLRPEVYAQAAGHVPLLCLNTEGFDWHTLREARQRFFQARSAAAAVSSPALVTDLLVIKGTKHQDQSDFPFVAAPALRRMGMTGKLPVAKCRETNSRLCLAFLHKHLLGPDVGWPYKVDVLEEDLARVERGDLKGQYNEMKSKHS